MDLINKIQKVQESTSNVILKNTCKSYINSIQASSSIDETVMAKNFLAQVSEIEGLSESESKSLLNDFKVYNVSILGVKDALDVIMEDSEFVVDPIYEDRINFLKRNVEDNHDKEYRVIENAIEVLSTFPEEDMVVNEQKVILVNLLKEKEEDIRVLNFVDYIKNSKDFKKYKKQYESVIERTEDYLMVANAKTKSNLIEALRGIPQDNEVKTFANWMSAQMFVGGTYHSGMDLGNNSISAGRVKTSYFNNVGKPANKQEAGKIVVESLQEADKMLLEMPRRNVIALLHESLSKEKLSGHDQRIFEGIETENKINNLGIFEAIDRMKTSIVCVKSPEVKTYLEQIQESIYRDTPDWKLAVPFVNALAGYKFDSIFEAELNKIEKNFKDNEESILIADFLERTENANKLGVYEGIRKDLMNYIETPKNVLKRSIVDKYQKFFFEAEIMNFVNRFAQINSINESKSFVVNTNPNEYLVEKVYSFVEKDSNKFHFIIGRNNYIRKGNDILVVNENRISPRVKRLTNIYNALNLKVVNETRMEGEYNGKKLEILTEDANSKPYIKINDISFANVHRDIARMTFESAFYNESLAMLEFYELSENIDSLCELDWVNKITYKQNPNIYCLLFKTNESFHVQLMNETVKYEKHVKSKNPKLVKDVIYEYMGFDVSKSLEEFMTKTDKKMTELSETATKQLEIIKKYNQKISDIKNELKGLNESEFKKQIELVLEELESEVETIKDDYADNVEALEMFNTPETNLEVGMEVSCGINSKIGQIIGMVSSTHCLVQFEDGSQSECFCTDLTPIEKKEDVLNYAEQIEQPYYDEDTNEIVEPEGELTIEEDPMPKMTYKKPEDEEEDYSERRFKKKEYR